MNAHSPPLGTAIHLLPINQIHWSLLSDDEFWSYFDNKRYRPGDRYITGAVLQMGDKGVGELVYPDARKHSRDYWEDYMLEVEQLDRKVTTLSRGLPRFDLDLLDGDPPCERDWIVPGFIPHGEVTLFTGPGGAGKSLFAQQLATCLAARLPFLGLEGMRFPNNDANAIAYITAEDDEHEMHRRQRNINRAVGATRRDLGDRLHLSSLRGRIGNELAIFDRDGDLEKTETFQLLSETIMDTGAVFAILDNLAHLFAGNENDRGQVTRFINLLYSLARTWGVSILLLGHPNKSGDGYSGSTAWLNAVRSHIEIDYVKDTHGNILDPDARMLKLGKANYARLGQRHEFRWHDFAFWRDEDLPADKAKEFAQLALANGENAAFLRCLAAATERKKAISENPGTNYFGSVFPKMPEGKGYGKDAFERAMHRLLAIGAIELDAKLWQRDNYAWKYGIRAVEKPTNRAHRPDPPTTTDPSVKPPPTDPLYTTYNPGAASRAAAPDEDTCEACSGVGCEWCKQ